MLSLETFTEDRNFLYLTLNEVSKRGVADLARDMSPLVTEQNPYSKTIGPSVNLILSLFHLKSGLEISFSLNLSDMLVYHLGCQAFDHLSSHLPMGGWPVLPQIHQC